ncbi:FAD-dependent oxidoreductase [Candidatus Marinamargulisbacteria bacterium SCGC AAA071-K20]|nr:FAD-dependent oxidoreductase [Candidatus Marinamargulisbacteria bacterium SCGC AAA071-K20]
MKRVCIIGGGIIGLTMAYWINHFFPKYSIRIIEKEPALGAHASGRNSGVLHAGFYYNPDSLKAKFCIEGQDFLINYIKENKLSINPCGKLIVAKDDEELDRLRKLKERGTQNGVALEWCNEGRVSKIDPLVLTHKNALFSPTTSTINPIEVLTCLSADLESKGVRFNFKESFSSFKNNIVHTNKDTYETNLLINCAGTYAIDIAKQFNMAKNYQMLPFKGLYLMFEGENPLKTNVYPVPPKDAPFLGVHFTITVDNKLKIGPTATPALSYEHYKGVENIRLKELIPILGYETAMFVLNKCFFRNLAVEEILKCFKLYLAEQACKLTKGLDPKLFTKWSKPGIRAQLLDKRNLRLLDDFVVEKKENTLHILNAVSPAFTASFSFTRHIVEEYIV